MKKKGILYVHNQTIQKNLFMHTSMNFLQPPKHRLKHGWVRVVSGPHKGKEAFYDDDGINDHDEWCAICYFNEIYGQLWAKIPYHFLENISKPSALKAQA
jgi:hypothetical protein